jgi:class 3 adenylate cyclase
MTEANHNKTGRADREKWQISIGTLAPLIMAALVVFAVVPVLVTGYIIATDTAGRLLSERAELIVDGLENQIRGQLDPVAEQLLYARQSFLKGIINPADRDELQIFLRGVLAGTPQVAGVAMISKDLTISGWARSTFGNTFSPEENPVLAGQAMEAARNGLTSYWAAPFVNITLNDTIMNHRVALEHQGEFFGILAAAVTSAALSRYVADISSQFGVTAFILLGRDRIIAHPDHQAPTVEGTVAELPLLADARNPVVAGMWNDPQPLFQISDLTHTEGHWTDIEGTPYIYFYRELNGYGPDPLTIGVAVLSAETARERWASTVAAGVGIVLMIFSATAAWYLGRRLARPAAEFNTALNAIARLEFDAVSLPVLEKSPVREWRKMARSLVSTATALSAFQTYLPRSLVRRIFNVSRGSVQSRERIVTLMFADLEGFTAFSKGRDATDVAAHLNDLFGSIGPILEASGGVIDKYTGDGLLAFWGAPDPQPDHAARACRAAADIARVMQQRAESGDHAFPRLRIGLHTGPVVVGNIGFPGRINYTLVGDTVNVAERTEAALRGVEPENPTVIAVTEAVLDAGGNSDAVLLKGRPLVEAPLPAFLCTPAT